jgi:hypothetical protein
VDPTHGFRVDLEFGAPLQIEIEGLAPLQSDGPVPFVGKSKLKSPRPFKLKARGKLPFAGGTATVKVKKALLSSRGFQRAILAQQ